MTEPIPKGLSLPRIEALSATIRTVFINIGFFAAVILLIPAVAGQFNTAAVVIEPIAVPAALADRGLTPEVAANRLWDGLQDFARTASVARSTIVAIPDSQRVEFSLPDTGISIDSLFTQVRQFLGIYETRIAGEIVCGTPDCAPAGQRLRLRVIRGTTDIVDLPPLGDRSEADYFRDAAAGVFDVLDPFVAIAARALTDPEGAASRARRLALSRHPDAKWAHNLLGDIARNGGDPQAATLEYQAALALDEAFNLARINLTRAQAATGDITAAEATLAEAARREPNAAGLPEARAEVALAKGDTPAAITHYLAAAGLNPVDPAPLVRAGALELETGLVAAGIGHLEEVLDLDPGHPEALRLLGNAYRADGDLAAAERLFRDWAGYAPQSPEAHLALAELLVERNDRAGAAVPYDHLATLLPDHLDHALARARNLLELKRYAQAVDGLTPFADSDEPAPAAIYLLARIQHAFGRHDRAIARYRQFLELAPDAPERVEAEAALAELGG